MTKKSNEKTIKSVLSGLSQIIYEKLSITIAESFVRRTPYAELSQQTINHKSMEDSTKVLKEFEKRDIAKYDFIRLLIDRKYMD